MTSPDVLVLVAHPQLEQSRVNRRMLGAAHALAGAADSRIEVRDLYALYPDYWIDVAAEQERLAQARLVVWQHPLQWYHMPPLMKLWVDEVLGFGWAYGPGGDALRGKDLWLVASTGGSEEAYRPNGYNRYFFDAFLPAYEQTAALCGMRFLPPLLLHGAHRATAAEVDAHAAVYAERLAAYPDWPELADLPAFGACEVPSSERPPAEAA
jgi:glutathione-regulated potassium-efflux system ancillary protein KefF